MTHETNDEGLTRAGERYLVSDRDLDALAEAQMAWERWERRALWWTRGDLDDPHAYDAA
jgi:hypothetical protein